MTHPDALLSRFGSKVRLLPGVLDWGLSIAADPSCRGYLASGWIEVGVRDDRSLLLAMGEDFHSLSLDMGFLHARARSEDVRLSLLVVERGRPSGLSPGFLSINFLSDEAEIGLVNFVRNELARADHHLAAAAVRHRAPEGVRDLLAAADRCLVTAATAMSWRRMNPDVGLQPSGPFLALVSATRLDGLDVQDQIRTLTGLVRDAAALCRQHFFCATTDVIPPRLLPARADGPLWYGEAQAHQYDQCRFFPRDIARPVNRLLDGVGCRDVVELGAGTGRFTLSLIAAGATQRFSAVDSSADMLGCLRAKLQGSVHQNVDVIHAGLDQLDPGVRRFDAILEHEAFFLHPNPGRLVRHLVDLLSPTGVLLRLERTLAAGEQISQVTDRFDRELAAGLGRPVGFVGEGIDDVLDAELRTAGLVTVRVPLTVADRQVRLADEVNARRQRAFPYLEQVPASVLDRASAVVLSAGLPDQIRVVERYGLAASTRATPDNEAALQEVVRLLQPTTPNHSART